jgi:hypothetical protein
VFRFIADALRWVGGVLAGVGVLVAAVSFVAGFFSFGTGWLGEIPAGTLIATGMLLWGVGDALDTTVDWAEGRISGTELLLSAGTSMALALGGAVVVKLGGKLFKKLAPDLYERLKKWIDNLRGRGPADPSLPGPLGKDFKPGLSNPTGRQLTKDEQVGADLLTAEGKHVQVLAEDHTVQRRKSVDFPSGRARRTRRHLRAQDAAFAQQLGGATEHPGGRRPARPVQGQVRSRAGHRRRPRGRPDR